MLCISLVYKWTHKLCEWSRFFCFFLSSASPPDLSQAAVVCSQTLLSADSRTVSLFYYQRGFTATALRELGANEGAVHTECLFFCLHFYSFFFIYIFMHNFRFNAGSSWKQREVTAMEPAKETLWVLQLLLTVPACTVSHSLNSTSVSWMEYHFDLLNWIHCRKQTENFVLKDNPLVYVFVFFFYELKLSLKNQFGKIFL